MNQGDQGVPEAIRIHGDNIIECERALRLVAEAFSATAVRALENPIYLPKYEVWDETGRLFSVELFAGHGRWGVDVLGIMQSHGSPLREAPDAIITRVRPDGEQEEIVCSIEFCNALLAGNQAWQRSGRALASASIGVPYLYIAELGGLELGSARESKASRVPNPIVPFSYLAASRQFDTLCLPVFLPSPSSPNIINESYSSIFGQEDCLRLIASLLSSRPVEEFAASLTDKALRVCAILAANRQRRTTLVREQWEEFLELETSLEKQDWLEENHLPWAKKRARKVQSTASVNRLFEMFLQRGFFHVCTSIGAADIPLCLVHSKKRETLAKIFTSTYGELITPEFGQWLASTDSPLVVVWITGFKPGGEDSRPDRGLVPMARMLFGNEIQILTIVHGPAQPSMWELFQTSPRQLATQNGLWEAVINLSDAVFVDSATAYMGPLFHLFDSSRGQIKDRLYIPFASSSPAFSEQDVDTVLHRLFTEGGNPGIFEGMCNPPGGDWSGISLLNFQTGDEYRWTSLPRVGEGGKRPDHVIHLRLEDGLEVLLAIESKDRASILGKDIGSRLEAYVRWLIALPPTTSRTRDEGWQLGRNYAGLSPSLLIRPGGAFLWRGEKDLLGSLARGGLSFAVGIEFPSGKQGFLFPQGTVLHLAVRDDAAFVAAIFREVGQNLTGGLEVKVH